MFKNIKDNIQLLLIFFSSLIIINYLFLTSASKLIAFQWIAGILIIASILNVYIFLFLWFYLQKQTENNEENKKSIKHNCNHKASDEEGKSIVNLNKLLPDYQKIHSILEENGISIQTFDTSKQEHSKDLKLDEPPFNLITYGFGFKIELFQKIVSLLKENKIKKLHISYSIHASNKNKLYIGSYAYKISNNFTELSEEIMVKISQKKLSEYNIGETLSIGSIENTKPKIAKKTSSKTYIAT